VAGQQTDHFKRREVSSIGKALENRGHIVLWFLNSRSETCLSEIICSTGIKPSIAGIVVLGRPAINSSRGAPCVRTASVMNRKCEQRRTYWAVTQSHRACQDLSTGSGKTNDKF
jgi:hypothetical protein